MFHSRTLFVVGAGASCEYGFPSGAQIKEKIARLIDIRFEDGYSQMSGDAELTNLFRVVAQKDESLGGNINPILHKCWLLRDALPAAISIDNLLHAHQGDAYVELAGKLAIVKAILQAERSSSLRPTERHPDAIDFVRNADTWLMWFFKMAAEGVTKGDLGKIFENVSIICFNYDRCIEWFIPKAIETYYGISAGEARELFNRLTILHPYGTIGPIERVPFGADRTDLLGAAQAILTFSEGLSDEAFMTAIRHEVAEAETLIFLGFAYHPMNMGLLTPHSDTDVRRIFATSYGLSDADEAVIEESVLEMVHKDRIETGEYGLIDANPSHVPEFANITCTAFFEKYFRSLSAPVR